jgi:homocysteine S-methyltransferase
VIARCCRFPTSPESKIWLSSCTESIKVPASTSTYARSSLLITSIDDSAKILDGGLATELQNRGEDVSGALWSAQLLQAAPAAIEQVHYDYFVAGARYAVSASYQASYEGFGALGLSADETTVLLRRSVELAQSARMRYCRDHPADTRDRYVAASVGPYGAISNDGAEYRGDYGLSIHDLVEFHARRFGVLAESGADVLACETLPLLDEARALALLLQRHPDARAWMTFTSPDGVRTSHGEPLMECAQVLDRVPGVLAVGVNCVKPEVVSAAIRSLRAGTGKSIVVYPNSGEVWDAQTRRWRGACSHRSLADLAPQWVSAGASLVGGCCRIGPREIAALDKTLSENIKAEGIR